MHPLDECKILEYGNGAWKEKARAVIVEQPLAISVNGEVLAELMCTPTDLQALTAGFLYNEGWIESLDDIASWHICRDERTIDVWLHHAVSAPQHWRRTSGCAGGITAAETNLPRASLAEISLAPQEVGALVRILSDAQQLYRQAGGIHTSVISDGKRVLLSAEDIGRHNSLDKLAGRLLQRPDLRAAARVLLTTGRISSEMLQKAVRMRLPVVISRTAPSSLAVQMAERSGITLLGYARGHRFIIYAHAERILRTEKRWPSVA